MKRGLESVRYTRQYSIIRQGGGYDVAPVIGLVPAAKDGAFNDTFPGAKTVLLKKYIPAAKETHMFSPKEITRITGNVVRDLKLDALMIPGSPRQINSVYYSGKAQGSSYNIAEFRQSTIKMGFLLASLELGIPILASCDGMNYLSVLAKGGKIDEVTDERKMVHNSEKYHGILIPPGSWLHDMALRVTQCRDKDRNVVLPSVMSTHPMYTSSLPDNSKCLASASDGTPAFVSYFTNVTSHVLGIQDHPEEPPGEKAHYERGGNIPQEQVVLDDTAYQLYGKVSESFSHAARLAQKDRKPVPENQLNTRILEILSVADLSAKSYVTRLSLQQEQSHSAGKA